jgi:hypothetical protein
LGIDFAIKRVYSEYVVSDNIMGVCQAANTVWA